MTSLSQLCERASTNADNIRDKAAEIVALLTGEHYMNMDILKEKIDQISILNIENELDVMTRMEEMSKLFSALLKLEKSRRMYRAQIDEKEKQSTTRESIRNRRREKKRNQACPYARPDSLE